jgi:exfoliative toxin A/B
MKLLSKISNMPLGAVAAFMGAATLANAWNLLGFVWVLNITMFCAAAVWLLYLAKIIFYFDSFKDEYAKVVPASLFGAFSTLLMILSIWLYKWLPFMRYVFFGAIALHAAHILVFTFRNVLHGVKVETFLPCWFVTYNAIMVCTVTGHIHLGAAGKIIVYYGLATYALLIVCLAARLVLRPVPPQFLHTTAVILAPVSLCVTSYINVTVSPKFELVIVLYIMTLLSVLYILVNTPRYFSVPFNPSFSGLTFPMAIGSVASFRVSAFLDERGFDFWSAAARQFGGVQLWITTAFISFVLYNFARLAFARKT